MENADRLLAETVAFNRTRLLCRLRSKHSTSRKGKTKKCFADSLHATVERLYDQRELPGETRQQLRRVSQDLQEVSDTLEDLETNEAKSGEADNLLRAILVLVDQLDSFCNLKEAMDTIPADDPSFPETRREYLAETVSKLARYIKLGPLLLRFARKYSIFRNIVAQPVLIRPQQRTLYLNHHKTSDAGILHRCEFKMANSKQFASKIRARFGGDLKMARSLVSKKSGQEGRVHAEIQLVTFFEQGPQTGPTPRVICASKNACYLCNLFLSLHGKFYTPRTHGKIYHQWILPNLSTSGMPKQSRYRLEDVYRQLQVRIEDAIKSSLVRRKLEHRFDNESRIFSIRSPSATEASIPEKDGVMENNEHDKDSTNEPRRDSAFAMPSPLPDGFSSDPPVEAGIAEAPDSDGIVEEDIMPVEPLDNSPSHQEDQNVRRASMDSMSAMTPVPSRSPPQDSTLQNIGTLEKPVLLVPGEPVCVTMLSDCCSVRLHTRRIHLELTYDMAFSICSSQSLELPIGQPEKGLRVTVTWLEDDEVSKWTNLAQAMDLGSNSGFSEVSKFELKSEGLLIRNGKDLVHLRTNGLDNDSEP